MQEIHTKPIQLRKRIRQRHLWSLSRICSLCRARNKRRFTVTLATALLLIAATLVTPHAGAQGCAQCLDTTRATPPATQAAYRHAIELLGGAASALFIAGLILLRRNP